MNILNLFAKSYGFLRNYKGIPFWVFTPLRRFIRYWANKLLPLYLRRTAVREGAPKEGVIISLTSFPARIATVWQVVKSLRNQTILPEKIILWLSRQQFPTRDSVPRSLWEQVDTLFEIRMVDDDIRSHKKYYYAMREFPGKTIVTCDDDIYYHPDMLAALLKGSWLYPSCVVANVTKRLRFDDRGNLLPYSQWETGVEAYATDNLVQIGVGGVLYPPHCLDETVLDRPLFMDICPLADDIWLNAMARKKGTPVVQSALSILPLPIKNEGSSLTAINVGESMNDRQIGRVRSCFKEKGWKDVYSAEYKLNILNGGGGVGS